LLADGESIASVSLGMDNSPPFVPSQILYPSLVQKTASVMVGFQSFKFRLLIVGLVYSAVPFLRLPVASKDYQVAYSWVCVPVMIYPVAWILN